MPSIVEMPFETRDDAKIWIIKNQFGRRNLAAFTRVELALKLEPLLKAKAKAAQVRKPDSVLAKLPKQNPVNTRKDLAKSAGVGDKMIDAGKLVAEHADEETKHKLRSDLYVKLHRVTHELQPKLQPQTVTRLHFPAFRNVKRHDSRSAFDSKNPGVFSTFWHVFG